MNKNKQLKYASESERSIIAEFVALIEPYCEGLMMVGELRRREHYFSKVKFVAVAKVVPVQRTLFEADKKEYSDLLLGMLDTASKKGVITWYKESHGGSVFELSYQGIDMLIRTSNGDSFGTKVMLHTGSKKFVEFMTTNRSKGGALPEGWKVAGGMLWNAEGDVVATKSEADYFGAIGCHYIDTEYRSEKSMYGWASKIWGKHGTA